MIPKTLKVPIYIEANGIKNYSRTFSYFVWKDTVGSDLSKAPPIPKNDEGLCSYCNGYKICNSPWGMIRCLCDMQEEQQYLLNNTMMYKTSYMPNSLSKLEIWGDAASQTSLIETIDYIQKWLTWPDKWITIIGIPGCGKSHILASIATTLGPWALYISMADFEARIFEAMDTNTLPDLINVIKRVPVLLLDDLGADYGSEFVKSNLRKVIDFRYQRVQEFPVVVTSNFLNAAAFYRYDNRIADRLLDVTHSKAITMNVKSYRRNDGNSII